MVSMLATRKSQVEELLQTSGPWVANANLASKIQGFDENDP